MERGAGGVGAGAPATTRPSARPHCAACAGGAAADGGGEAGRVGRLSGAAALPLQDGGQPQHQVHATLAYVWPQGQDFPQPGADTGGRRDGNGGLLVDMSDLPHFLSPADACQAAGLRRGAAAGAGCALSEGAGLVLLGHHAGAAALTQAAGTYLNMPRNWTGFCRLEEVALT